MLHIGILAHSADGSALCYLEMVRHSARLLAHAAVGVALEREALPTWRGGPLRGVRPVAQAE